jgi:DNA adenine methylase
VTGVFLDPPYSDPARDKLYAEDSYDLGSEIEAWCRQWQDHPKMRIALCGYEGEYDLPAWDCVAWKAHGGYGNQSGQHDNPNARKERIWFSPHCLERCDEESQLRMF